MKFVIIGETGSGKTSFLNYLCNLPLMQAEVMKQERGQPGAFDKWEQRSFHVGKSEHGGRSSESQTKDANVYTVKGYDIDITAIDTPGLADTMGMEADEKHLQKMQKVILEQGYINCVVLVVNGRVPKATAQISYVLSRLTAVLPSAIADKIIVVYTRVDIREMLEFDPATIEKVIGRTLPAEQEFVFDNPFACVELLQKSARRTGQPTSAKALKKLKLGFTESNEEFQALLQNMTTFPPVDVKFFQELFEAKASIEREVVTLDNLLKNNAEKQASVTRALQDLSTAKDWKKKMEGFEKSETHEEWVTIPNESGTHDMVCNGCKRTCHKKCRVPMAECPSRFKGCECFSSKTPKTFKVRNADDLAAVKAKVTCRTSNLADVETQALDATDVEVLTIADNCTLCGVDIMGDPAGDDSARYEVWVKDVPFDKRADAVGQNMDNVQIGAEIRMRDWSNLMKGTDARCRTCECKLGLHGHQTFMWKKNTETRSIINENMKRDYDHYQSEEEHKATVLNGLKIELQKLEKEADIHKRKLQHAVDTFKEKSTQTSYVRVLRAQMEYLDFQKEATNSDATIVSDVRDARLKAITDQQRMLRSNLSVLVEVGSERLPRLKTQKCSACNGSGLTNGWFGLGTKQTCSTCHGQRHVTKG